jgi:hypothetical protein
MKWSTLLSKVVFAAGQQQQEQPPVPPPPPPVSPLHQQADADLAAPRLSSASTGGDGGGVDAAAGSSPSAAASLSRWVPPLLSPSQVRRSFRRSRVCLNRIRWCPVSLDVIWLLALSGLSNGAVRIWTRGTVDRTCRHASLRLPVWQFGR